jgi:hypothetical protein
MSLGRKKIETRGWRTSYRGLLAIHAAKRKPTQLDLEVMRDTGIVWRPQCGLIVAVVDVIDCLPTEVVFDCYPTLRNPEEERFGNYAPHRFGIVTQALWPLPNPLPFKSRQGMLMDISGDLVGEICRQVGLLP